VAVARLRLAARDRTAYEAEAERARELQQRASGMAAPVLGIGSGVVAFENLVGHCSPSLLRIASSARSRVPARPCGETVELFAVRASRSRRDTFSSARMRWWLSFGSWDKARSKPVLQGGCLSEDSR